MATPGYDAAVVIVDKLTAAGIVATTEPRSATPPCVLLQPPDKTYDVGCGFTAGWHLIALAPLPANADAWRTLDNLETTVASLLPVSRSVFTQYQLFPDGSPLPAYRIDIEEGV